METKDTDICSWWEIAVLRNKEYQSIMHNFKRHWEMSFFISAIYAMNIC
jgi:hypothetical protein